MQALELKVPPVAVGLLLGAAMWAAARHLPFGRFAFPGRHILSVLLLLAGLALPLLGVLAFRSSRTTVDPLHPEKASSLVDRGIYRLSRNPMYLGFLLLLVSWALRLGSLPALLLAPLFVLYMDRFQIVPEERALDARFGAEFRAYRERTRRWI